MLSKIISAVLILFVITANAQYKNDNVLYKTVDWTNLCQELQKNTGYLLLDVRSPGEYSDTSAFVQLNIGHLKGAENINVRELGSRLGEIGAYKDKPVFVYCSHSQRSRRASKMLADSGFTKVYNINAGMTAFYYGNAKNDPCLKSLLVTNNSYAVISAADLCTKLANKPNNIFILDVRSDSAFEHISTDAKDNALGTVKHSTNIPLSELANRLDKLPHNKEIIITDLYGGDAAKAAALLKTKGFEKVSVLIEGIERWISEDDNAAACISNWYVSPVAYHLVNTVAFGKLALDNKNNLLLDVRTADEFENKHKDNWRNIGHIKNAVNIPSADINTRVNEITAYKNKPVLLYDFSGGTQAFDAANALSRLGFTNVNVLVNGLFNIRWTAANRNKPYLKDLLTGVPDYNL